MFMWMVSEATNNMMASKTVQLTTLEAAHTVSFGLSRGHIDVTLHVHSPPGRTADHHAHPPPRPALVRLQRQRQERHHIAHHYLLIPRVILAGPLRAEHMGCFRGTWTATGQHLQAPPMLLHYQARLGRFFLPLPLLLLLCIVLASTCCCCGGEAGGWALSAALHDPQVTRCTPLHAKAFPDAAQASSAGPRQCRHSTSGSSPKQVISNLLIKAAIAKKFRKKLECFIPSK